jgi:hypothetical protein
LKKWVYPWDSEKKKIKFAPFRKDRKKGYNKGGQVKTEKKGLRPGMWQIKAIQSGPQAFFY